MCVCARACVRACVCVCVCVCVFLVYTSVTPIATAMVLLYRFKMPDLNCQVQDLLLEVVDLKQEVTGSEIRWDPPI